MLMCFEFRTMHSFENQCLELIIQAYASMGCSPGDESENPMTQEKRKKGWRMSCDVGEATEGLENDL